MRTFSLPRYTSAFIATIYTFVHPQARQARAVSVGEMTDQDFPYRPNYDWLHAHEDNSLPAEYRPGARLAHRKSLLDQRAITPSTSAAKRP